ncbi:MAG: hypothetical protein Q9195_002801 [Heterodermia aff. obscurata]
MAPSLESSNPKIDLIESAVKCELRLDSLRQHARDLKVKHTSGKKHALLEEVITRSNSNIQSLKAWTAAISRGRQTSDESIRASINEVFENILSRKKDAQKALDHRLALVFALEKYKKEAVEDLRSAMNEIRDTIGYLHNQVRTVLRDTPDQKEREKRFTEMSQRRPKSYHTFKRAIEKMSEAERRSIRFGTYALLWAAFPAKLDLVGNVGNRDEPGDGKVYEKQSIKEVESILKAFYDAWSDATMNTNDIAPMSPDTIRNVSKIPEMAKICLILRGMKQERLLDDFCKTSRDDKHLPFKPEGLKTIFDPEDADHAEIFCAEQYRAISRTWNDGEHIKVADAEPLPLEFIKEYGSGSYGSVKRMKDAFTGAYFACKEQISAEARAHLLREIARLKKLGHRHIVQFVKSYQRGDRYGILLKPAATTDLRKLLDRYRRNGLDYDRDARDRRRDRVVFKPILFTAFGCLSRGLAHIHNCNIRHKDIKPANILYEKAMGRSPARFLWADFGLAHDFSNLSNSRTVSRNRHRYSPRYAAPEIMEEFEARKARGEIDYDTSDDDEEDAPAHAPEGSQSASGTRIGHGRSSDIYSLGIVFLEILSYLIAEGPEPTIPEDFEKCMPFWKNIARLDSWAHKKIERLSPSDPLVFLFQLSCKMIKHKATERPVISDIVKELAAANPQYFCSVCLKDPPEPISQAVIAEEQMVEGLEKAKQLSESLHHVNSREHGSIHDPQQVPAEEPPPQDNARRRRFSRTSVYHNGVEPIVKRSSMRSPARLRDRPPSVLRFSTHEEVVPDFLDGMAPGSVDNKENHMPRIPSIGT